MAKKTYSIDKDKLDWLERQFNALFVDFPENSQDLKDAILSEIEKLKNVLNELEIWDKELDIIHRTNKDQKQLYSAMYNQQKVRQETQELIDYLKYRAEDISPIKSTQYKELKERYAIMKILGFFDSRNWKAIEKEKDKDELLAEILQCDIDNAKKVRSIRPTDKYRLDEERRKDIEDRIMKMQEGGL